MDKNLQVDEYIALWQKFSRTRAAIAKARQKKYGKYFHPNWGGALTIIWSRNGKATPGLLSRTLFLEHHSVSELINRLEEKGLVKRMKDPAKKSSTRLFITEKGRQDCYESMQADFIRSTMALLSSEQREQLDQCLTLLLKGALKELDIPGDITS